MSEYVPEIVAFTQRIVENGFAYEGGGSVWFDVAKFEGAQQQDASGVWTHEYAKLQPGSKGNRKLLDEGEGELVPLALAWIKVPILVTRQKRSTRTREGGETKQGGD